MREKEESESRRSGLSKLIGHHVGDVVPRVSVQALLESLLVEEVADEAQAASEHEYAVEGAALDELVGLLHGEAAAVAQHVDHGDADDAVHVQNEVGLLRRRDLLHLERVVEQRRAREVLLGELTQQDHSHVRIVQLINNNASFVAVVVIVTTKKREKRSKTHRFDSVADAHDQLSLLSHLVDELHGRETGIVGLAQLLGRTVQSATESLTLDKHFQCIVSDKCARHNTHKDKDKCLQLSTSPRRDTRRDPCRRARTQSCCERHSRPVRDRP